MIKQAMTKAQKEEALKYLYMGGIGKVILPSTDNTPVHVRGAVCPHCDADITNTDKFCHNCGQAL